MSRFPHRQARGLGAGTCPVPTRSAAARAPAPENVCAAWPGRPAPAPKEKRGHVAKSSRARRSQGHGGPCPPLPRPEVTWHRRAQLTGAPADRAPGATGRFPAAGPARACSTFAFRDLSGIAPHLTRGETGPERLGDLSPGAPRGTSQRPTRVQIPAARFYATLDTSPTVGASVQPSERAVTLREWDGRPLAP